MQVARKAQRSDCSKAGDAVVLCLEGIPAEAQRIQMITKIVSLEGLGVGGERSSDEVEVVFQIEGGWRKKLVQVAGRSKGSKEGTISDQSIVSQSFMNLHPEQRLLVLEARYRFVDVRYLPVQSDEWMTRVVRIRVNKPRRRIPTTMSLTM